MLAGCSHLAMDKSFDLRFYNNSDVEVSVSSTLSRDNSFILIQEIVIKAHDWSFVYGDEYNDYLDRLYAKYNTDTIFYDMSLADAKHVYDKDCFAFPPTEAMRNIKMWPPYGTYDSLGHLVQ